MAILLTNQQKELPINELKLKRRLGKVLKALGLQGSTVSVLITTDEHISALNKEFRGQNRPTNVLSFPSKGPPRDGLPEVAPPDYLPAIMRDYLGDIAISSSTVKREASALELPEGYLFYFYLIHSILHLIGHDHELGEEEDRAQDQETKRLMELIPHTLD